MAADNNLLETIANRLFASWRTSLLALGLVAVLLGLVFAKVIPWERAEGWLGTAIVLFFFRDNKQVEQEKQAAVRKALRSQDDPRKGSGSL